jgi:glycosyltransferase involved in cell wall biosynthesis
MSSEFPRISIVTPSYQQGDFLEQTIQSVLSQGYPNLDYIVMDGGSKDQTVSILKRYEGQLRWFSEKDEGQSDAINKGFRLATGEICGYLNSDDLLLPGSLKIAADFFIHHPAAAWMTAPCTIINEHGKETAQWITQYKNFLLNHYSTDMLLVINFISQMSTFWRRSAMEQAGEFSRDHHLVMDYDFWLRLLKQGPPGIVQQPLSCFRVHSGSKGSQRFVEQFEQSYQVASQHIRSPWLRALSWLHNRAVIIAYRMIARAKSSAA